MKKNYMTPQIVYDDFQLSENIAMCELINSEQNRYQCPVLDAESGWTIFIEGTTCAQSPADGEQICYEVPFENYNVFVS